MLAEYIAEHIAHLTERRIGLRALKHRRHDVDVWGPRCLPQPAERGVGRGCIALCPHAPNSIDPGPRAAGTNP